MERRRRSLPRLSALAASMAMVAFVPVAVAHPAAATDAAGVAVDPVYGPPLITIKVSGAQFCGPPCGPVAIAFGSLSVADGIGVNPDGSFTAFVRVPGTVRPGAVPVIASQTQANGAATSAQTDYTVTVSTPAPTSYPPVVSPLSPTGAVPPPGVPPAPGTAVPGAPTTAPAAQPAGGTGPAGSTTSPTSPAGIPTRLVSAAGAARPAGTGTWPRWLAFVGAALAAAAAGAAVFRWRHRRRA